MITSAKIGNPLGPGAERLAEGEEASDMRHSSNACPDVTIGDQCRIKRWEVIPPERSSRCGYGAGTGSAGFCAVS